ncbi:MAG TPA: hydrogenase maturation protease [Kofleriaceae bacterium]|nr:hydrogenase maturation protease [Kofleriaceae bacterium]
MTAGGARARVLVAGVGNIFLGDDGFGPEVVRRLASQPLPDSVVVVDFGIRAIDLAYAIDGGHELVILVDAVGRGGPPGTVYLLEPDPAEPEVPGGESAALAAGHSLVPEQVIALVRSLTAGHEAPAIRIVGCEPAFIPTDPEIVVGLTAPVQAAVDHAVALVVRLVAEATGEQGRAEVSGADGMEKDHGAA